MSLGSVVVFVLMSLSAARAPAARGGRICVARAKNDGLMNGLRVGVWGDQPGKPGDVAKPRRLVELKGGAKACASVPLGSWSLEGRSRGLFAPVGSDPTACRSAPLVVEVHAGETVNVSIEPLGRPPSYFCGWELN